MLRNICPIASILAAAWLIVPTAPADTPATQPAPESSQTESNEGKSRPEEGRQPEWLLHLDELSFDLGLESSYDRRVVSYDTRQFTRYRFHQTNRDFRLEETIGTRAAGALFDENVMLFDVGARWGMSQEWFRETRPGPDLRKSPHGDLLEYDLNFTLLPHGMVSANAYASRVDSRIPRAFQPSLDRTLERYGAGLFLNHRTFPMRLTFEHVWDDLDSRTDRLLDREERGRDTLAYEATWQISDRHSLRLDYQYDDRSERYSGGRTRFDTTRNYITLNHQLRFGLDGRSALETLARFQDETGDLARDIAEVSTQLRLQHTDSLSTNYRAQYLRESYQQLTTETWRGDIGLTHQLGDTLTSSLQLYGLRQSADENADFTEWGGVVSEYFSRDNKLGRFSANLSYNHAATDTEFGKRRGVVVYESLTFRDPLLAYLAHPDVDLLNLVVTDVGRTRVYLPGADYIAVPIGRYWGLRRVPTGRIANGETVAVSYTYRAYDDYDISRDRVDLRIQQDFDFGLTPYYAASIQDENIDLRRFLAFRERNVNRHRIGATYRQKRWSVGLEYEYNDDSIDPYEAVHVNGDVVIWQNARHQLDGNGTLSRFRFDGSNRLESRDTLLLDVGTSYRYLIARNFEANASAMYRYEDDSFYGITHGVDLTGALELKIGYFSLRFEAEYDVLDLPNSTDDAFAVWLKLRREIPVVSKGQRL